MARTTTYAQAGVSLAAADEFEDQLGPLVRRTYGPRVLSAHGGFAGLFRLDFDEKLFKRNYRDPVLVSCTDGVGSKILLASTAKRFNTVGIDLVAMNVNDMLCCGAEPLFFLDYLALPRLSPKMAAEIVAGIAAGCEEAHCALLGGETAELPDLYRPGYFDLAGFAVGVVERKKLIQPKKVKSGDVAIGLPSSGLHSNGYALARRLLLRDAQLDLDSAPRGLGEPLINALLRPTRIYVDAVMAVLHHYKARNAVTGLAHITGGGLPGNVPRLLPEGCDLVITRGAWPIPPIFALLEHHGVAEDEMYRVFNMGIGLVMTVRPHSAGIVLKLLERAGEKPVLIGRVKSGSGKVEIR